MSISKRTSWHGVICATVLAALAGDVIAQGSTTDGQKSESRQESKQGSKKSGSSSSTTKAGTSAKNTTRKSDNGSSQTSPGADRPIDPSSFDEALLSRLIFDLTNVERKRANLPEFDRNQYLNIAAQNHSRDMASRSYFNHKSKGIFNRTSHSDRIASTGYRPQTSAENIAMIPTFNSQRIQTTANGQRVVDVDYNTYQRMAVYAVQQWMNSPGHRANILNRSLTELGVGTAVGMQGNIPYVYLTQNFGG